MLLFTASLLCKTRTIYSRLTPRSTCKHLGRLWQHLKNAGRRERHRRRRRTVVPTGLRKRSIRCVRPPACLLVCRWGKRRGRSAFHAFEYFRAIDGCTPQFDHAFHNQPARRPGCGERPLAGELQSFICPALLQTAANK